MREPSKQVRSRLGALSLALLLGGCATASYDGPVGDGRYVFNGLFGEQPHIGRAMNELSQRLAGRDALSHDDVRTREVRGHVGPVCLVGHSLGALRAVRTAREARRPIAFLATVDAPEDFEVPSNVRVHVDFRQWERGEPSYPEGSRTRREGHYFPWEGHLSVGRHPFVQQTIERAVRRHCPLSSQPLSQPIERPVERCVQWTRIGGVKPLNQTLPYCN